MYPQELATVLQHGAAVICIVVNYRHVSVPSGCTRSGVSGRPIATDLLNPDFVGPAQPLALTPNGLPQRGFPAAFERPVQPARQP